MAIKANDWQDLKAAWDAYGHAVPFEKLKDIKSQRGCYAVVCWEQEDGTLGLADLARGGRDLLWEMQNDGFDSIPASDWKKLKIVAECDWFVIPGNEAFQGN
jgi:hypothetical protein